MQLLRFCLAGMLLSVWIAAFPLQSGEIESPKAKQMGKAGRKLGSRLQHYVSEVASRGVNERAAVANLKKELAGVIAPAKDPAKLSVELDLEITDDNLALIRATGATIKHTSPRWNSCLVEADLSQIKRLSEIDSVKLVRLPLQPRTRTQGNANNQADISQRSDLVRATGLTGAGQRVGVLSDTVNRSAQVGAGTVTGAGPVFNLSGTTPQNSGELPADIKVLDFGEPSGSDEGAAMLELIHDIAPGAELVFATAFPSEVVFAENLLKMRTQANCTITVDDIGYLESPYFQDGPVAQVITQNAAAGVIHFSAGGNDFENGIVANYADNVPGTFDEADPPTGNDFHNWGIGGASPELLPIDVPPLGSVLVVLQWNQPFSTYNLGQGSEADLDLYLFDSGKNIIIGEDGRNFQGTPGFPNGDPVEFLSIDNNLGVTQTFYLAVDHYDGSMNNLVMRLMFFAPSQLTFPLGSATKMSMFGHPNTAECLAIGAVAFSNAPSTGTVGPAEGFTSRGGRGSGGVPFYFSTTGAALPGGIERRDKPELAAADRTNTSFFGSDSGTDPDSFPNFSGTSAAAPNAAAVAALLMEHATITPAQMKSLLQATARDVANGTPVGPDAFTGSGFIDAKAAFDALPTVTDPLSQTVDAGDTATFTVTASGNAQNIQWLKNGAPITGASQASYTTPALTFSDNNAAFACVVSNQYGSVTSASAILTVNSPPIFVQHPGATVINPGATAMFSVQVTGTAPFTYQWTLNNDPITGAESSSYTTPAVALVNSGDQYRCEVTNGSGTVISNPGILTVNTPPALSSTLLVLPNPALTGQTVSFAAFASDAQNQAVTYVWNFGDSHSRNGSNAVHIYNAVGTYHATITATDTLGLSSESTIQVVVSLDTDKDFIADINDPDDDNDGVSDVLEQIAGTSPLDAGSTPFGSAPALGSGPLDATKVSIKLNFVLPLKDSLSLSGTLPIAANYNPSGQTVMVNFGGISKSFILDDKGRSLRLPDGSFKVSYKKKKNIVLEQIGKYQMKLSKQSFADQLADEGLTGDADLKLSPRQVDITLFAAQQILQVRRTVLYSAKTGKSGSAK